MSAPMNIPGYYYDAAKKKYFKIQTSGATPAGSAYSKDDIKKREREAEQAEAARRSAEARKRSIKHSDLLSRDTIPGQRWAQQLGGDNPSATALRDARAGLIGRQFVNSGAYVLRPPKNSSSSIQAFDFDPMSRRLFTAESESVLASIPEFWHFKAARMNHDLTPYTRSPKALGRSAPRFQMDCGGVHMARDATSPITSVTRATADCRFLLTTWRERAQIFFLPDTSQGNISPEDEDQIMGSVLFEFSPSKNGARFDCSSSAAAPSSSPYVFALGSASDIGMVQRDSLDIFEIHANQKTTCLGFLGSSGQIIIAGSRTGLAPVFDIRQPTHRTGIKLQHPSLITNVKPISEDRIVVSGTESSLHQYDLRFLRSLAANPASHDHPRNGKRRRGPAPQVTQPCVTYAGYQNGPLAHIGLDVSVETGLLAAAHDDQTLHLYALHTGQQLVDLTPARGLRASPEALRFVDDGWTDVPSLWAAVGGGIVRYAWRGDDEGSADDRGG